MLDNEQGAGIAAFLEPTMIRAGGLDQLAKTFLSQAWMV